MLQVKINNLIYEFTALKSFSATILAVIGSIGVLKTISNIRIKEFMFNFEFGREIDSYINNTDILGLLNRLKNANSMEIDAAKAYIESKTNLSIIYKPVLDFLNLQDKQNSFIVYSSFTDRFFILASASLFLFGGYKLF